MRGGERTARRLIFQKGVHSDITSHLMLLMWIQLNKKPTCNQEMELAQNCRLGYR